MAMWRKKGSLAICLAATLAQHARSDEPVFKAEVVVYGGTPAGVMAAVAAARQGHTVALVDINAHVGGVVSGGLVSTDIGDRATSAPRFSSGCRPRPDTRSLDCRRASALA